MSDNPADEIIIALHKAKSFIREAVRLGQTLWADPESGEPASHTGELVEGWLGECVELLDNSLAQLEP